MGKHNKPVEEPTGEEPGCGCHLKIVCLNCKNHSHEKCIGCHGCGCIRSAQSAHYNHGRGVKR